MHQHELSVMKMTLSSHNMSSDNNRSVSPTSSPRSSPRPSPKPQTKRDHSPRSEIHLSTSFKEPPLFNKNDLSPINPFADFSLSSGRSSVNEFQTPDFNRSESTGGSSTKDNNNKKEGKSKKKTAWFSVLYPTYKSRSEDFKQTFKDAPDDERLVVDYSCALQKEILVQGRLYVSQNYLRFYANIFGWETSVSVKWKDVTAITKEKTALVIPNAVLIATRNDKFFFTSFVARDKTYLMLFRVWQNALMDRPMNQQEMWQLVRESSPTILIHESSSVHDSYGAELGLTSDDEDYIAPGTEDEKFSGRMSIESYSEECASNADGTGGNDQQMILEDSKLDDDNQSQSASDSRTNQQDLMIMNGNGNGTGGGGIIEIFQQELDVAGHSSQQMPTDFSDTTESDHDKDKTVKSLSPARCSHDPPILDPPDTPNSHEPMNHPRDPSRSSSDEKLYPVCSALHKGKQLMNEVISLHVDKLFTLLFTSSKFFLDFHEGRKTTDLKQTLWSIDAENIKSRVINLTVALNQPVGPKTAQVTEKQ
ncbi:PREDICTED: GRAM domain-containing protein 1B-like, partial [Nicrophorus vespilloides]|uniref:GRAM domain-containing protein 1B-like n=1 Tax=Nicrophorus vespilloides TaxID=110193 RepID=A0ABM1MRK4_NICVS